MKDGKMFCLMFVFVLMMAGCGMNSNEVILDSFEGVLDKTTVDFGSSEYTTLKVSAAKDIKFCGSQSMKLDYDLKQGGYMYCARGYGLDVPKAQWKIVPEKVNWDQYSSISFQMFGSKSGDVAFDVKDAGGELYRHIVKGDFEGWKEIIIPFNDFLPREDWQPETADGNKLLNFPIQSFQFEPKTIGVNTLYFDCVKVVK